MEKNLKVLMISSDRNVLAPGSAVSERMKEYGSLVEELHIVLLCDKFHTELLKIENSKLKISDNVWVYPTNSLVNFLRPLDAARLGKKVVFEKKFVRGQSVITAQDPFECGWAGMKIKKKWRLPLEIQVHTDPFSPYFSGFQNRVRKFFARQVLRNADSIRVVSEYLKLKAKSLQLEAEISVLPIYVDKERIENTPITFDLHARYPWRFILLAASRLTPEKNLSLALQTLALVVQKFPNVGLVIAGSGPDENRLKVLVKKLNLESSVEFAGWQNDMTSFYKTANAFIQTSFFEGHQLSLVEAGLSGLPILTTPAGIASELEHGKDAYIYPVGRPDLFAGGIIALIENNQIREHLRLNMKRTLETRLVSKDDYMAQIKANWEKTAKRVSPN